MHPAKKSKYSITQAVLGKSPSIPLCKRGKKSEYPDSLRSYEKDKQLIVLENILTLGFWIWFDIWILLFEPWPRPGFERPVSKKANYEFFLRLTRTPSVSHQGRLYSIGHHKSLSNTHSRAGTIPLSCWFKGLINRPIPMNEFVPIHIWLFSTISASDSDFNPRNTRCMDACPAVFKRGG